MLWLQNHGAELRQWIKVTEQVEKKVEDKINIKDNQFSPAVAQGDVWGFKLPGTRAHS